MFGMRTSRVMQASSSRKEAPFLPRRSRESAICEQVEEHAREQHKLAFKNAANQVAIAEQGGIKVIFQTLNFHLGDPEVQKYGCCALGNIGGSQRYVQGQIKDAGFEAAALSAVSAAASPEIKKSGIHCC